MLAYLFPPNLTNIAHLLLKRLEKKPTAVQTDNTKNHPDVTSFFLYLPFQNFSCNTYVCIFTKIGSYGTI